MPRGHIVLVLFTLHRVVHVHLANAGGHHHLQGEQGGKFPFKCLHPNTHTTLPLETHRTHDRIWKELITCVIWKTTKTSSVCACVCVCLYLFTHLFIHPHMYAFYVTATPLQVSAVSLLIYWAKATIKGRCVSFSFSSSRQQENKAGVLTGQCGNRGCPIVCLFTHSIIVPGLCQPPGPGK